MSQYNNISEFLNEKSNLAFAPVNLFPIGTVFNKTFYSSLKLKEEYKELIKRSKLLDPVRDTILKLVDQGEIIPCYASSGFITFAIRKFFAALPFGPSSYTVAFYHAKSDKIYAPFESQISTLMDVDDKFCSFVLLHELQHYCAAHLKQKQYSLFSKMYDTWYSNFFNYYFKTDNIKVADVEKIAKFLATNGDWTNDMFTDMKHWFTEYYRMVYNLTDKYNLDKKKVQNFFNTIRLILLNRKQYKQDIDSSTEPSITLFSSALLAYRKMGYKVNTLAYQELCYPSEIASMTCSINKIQPIHYKVIQMLG